MTHKVHPKIFRIKEMKDWDSRGFYGKRPAKILEEDFRIREFLKKKIGEAGIAKIEIERFSTELIVIVHTARPGLIIGRRGERAKKLREQLIRQVLRKYRGPSLPHQNFRLEFKAIKDPWLSASLASQQIARELEKGTRFRRALKRALSKIMSHKEVQGARVQVSGRVNGVNMARTEWLQEGRLPRQTIRADIDYSLAEAFCSYGVLGVKVWIYKGDRF